MHVTARVYSEGAQGFSMQNRPPLMLKYRRESRAPRRRLLIFPTRAKFHALLRHRPRASTKISSIPWPTEHANSKLHVTRNTSMTFPAKSPVRSVSTPFRVVSRRDSDTRDCRRLQKRSVFSSASFTRYPVPYRITKLPDWDAG